MFAIKAILLPIFLLTCLPLAPPAVPIGADGYAYASDSDRSLLARIAFLISEGRFADAGRDLRFARVPARVSVAVDYSAAPESDRLALRKAVERALESWNRKLKGTTTFVQSPQSDDCRLEIAFAPDLSQSEGGEYRRVCLETQAERQSQDGSRYLDYRKFRASISLSTPEPGGKHSPASLTHLIGQVLGAYLGLGSSAAPGDIMGPDSHRTPPAQAPSARDLQRLGALTGTRNALEELARKKVAAHFPRPVLVLDQTEKDAGELWRGETTHFAFTVRNTGDAPLRLTATSHCGCTVARFDPVIPPGGSGRVEAEMRTASFQGQVTKLVTLETNDPKRPQETLRLRARIRPILAVARVSPVLDLATEGPTVREYLVSTGGPQPVEITGVKCASPFARAELARAADGQYRVTVTVQADAPLGRSVVQWTAFSNSSVEPQISVTQTCVKGIVATPASLFLGLVAPAPAEPVRRTLQVTSQASPFTIRQVTTDDPNLEVAQQPLVEGRTYQLTLTYKGGWHEGAIRRTVTIKTDSALQPQVEIVVLATVQSPEAKAQP